jgi:hypothetical protein
VILQKLVDKPIVSTDALKQEAIDTVVGKAGIVPVSEASEISDRVKKLFESVIADEMTAGGNHLAPVYTEIPICLIVF